MLSNYLLTKTKKYKEIIVYLHLLNYYIIEYNNNLQCITFFFIWIFESYYLTYIHCTVYCIFFLNFLNFIFQY